MDCSIELQSVTILHLSSHRKSQRSPIAFHAAAAATIHADLPPVLVSAILWSVPPMHGLDVVAHVHPIRSSRSIPHRLSLEAAALPRGRSESAATAVAQLENLASWQGSAVLLAAAEDGGLPSILFRVMKCIAF